MHWICLTPCNQTNGSVSLRQLKQISMNCKANLKNFNYVHGINLCSLFTFCVCGRQSYTFVYLVVDKSRVVLERFPPPPVGLWVPDGQQAPSSLCCSPLYHRECVLNKT